MDHILLIDPGGRVIVSTLDPGCREHCYDQSQSDCETCKPSCAAGARRRGKVSFQIGTAFFCTDNANMLKSKSVFRRSLKFYAEMLGAFAEIQRQTIQDTRKENSRLVHNLTTLNSHIIQEIYNIVTQDDLAGRPSRQIDTITDAILSDPREAAAAALRILKNAIAARAEMQIVRRLHGTAQLPVQQRAHSIHKVVTNVLITFFQDFQVRQIALNVRECYAKVLLEYESVSAAFYRLLENCAKYCAPDSTIDISFSKEDGGLSVIIEMRSLPISFEEQDLIFDEGYSGEAAKKAGLSGSGLGLFFVRELLNLNSATIRVDVGTRLVRVQGRDYAPNRFVVQFPQGSLVRGK